LLGRKLQKLFPAFSWILTRQASRHAGRIQLKNEHPAELAVENRQESFLGRTEHNVALSRLKRGDRNELGCQLAQRGRDQATQGFIKGVRA
jgi:hypothetical protein